MNNTTLKKTVLLTLACIGMVLAPNIRAAHVTEFLDPLATEVSLRLENPDLTATDRRALNSAAKTLNRNTKTVTSELSALGSATKTLAKAFPDDEPLAGLANDAVNNYINDGQGQLNAVRESAGSGEVPPALSNALARADASLETANDTSLSISDRVKATSKAINAIRVADRLALRLFKAPLTLESSTVTLDGRESDRDQFDGTLNSDGSYTFADNGDGEETGSWSYERTTASTGTVTLNPTVGDVRTLGLKFSKRSQGTFTGQDSAGENVRGKFTVAVAL